jgi:hypothetical protein
VQAVGFVVVLVVLLVLIADKKPQSPRKRWTGRL